MYKLIKVVDKFVSAYIISSLPKISTHKVLFYNKNRYFSYWVNKWPSLDLCIAFEDGNIIKNCCIFNQFLFEIGSRNWVAEIWSNVLHLLHVNHFITWNSRQMRTFYPAFYLLVRIHYIHINTHAPVVHIPFFMLNHLIIYVYISDHYFRSHIFYETIRIMRKYYVPKFHETFYLILYILLYVV